MGNGLLDEIERYLAAAGISPSRFGRAAVNDTHLVFALRRGRRIWPETEAKVRKYLQANPISVGAAARDADR